MKKLYGCLAFISVILLIGNIGGVEQDLVPLAAGAGRAFVFLILFGIFTYLANKKYKKIKECKNYVVDRRKNQSA